MYEKEDMVDALLEKNSARRKRQKKLDIRVIVGNPPYSIGQGSQNDNNQNVGYPHLDGRIRETYSERSNAALSKGLYDTYIRAIRWASDRIGNAGVIGFVTNAGWLEANAADGLRKCLAEEFSNIYVFHLRGNQRTSGELSRKEGGKIFGSGSRAPIAISLLVKNPQASAHGRIHFYDIGDYMSREEKLEKIQLFGSVTGIADWQAITPDDHGDWLNQRDDRFGKYIVLGDKKSDAPKLFQNYSQGVVTSRDAWCYNGAKAGVADNMMRMIDFYNDEAVRFAATFAGLDKKAREGKVDGFIDTDPTKISWSVNLKQELVRDRRFTFEAASLTHSLYRPFILANKLPLERQLGVDLIYVNETLKSVVFVQYKMFSGTDGEDGYRPDGQLDKEIVRIDAAAARLSEIAPDESCSGYRFGTDPFFLKFCSKLVPPDAIGHVPGIYVPVSYWKRLIETPAAKGSRGGSVVYAETFGRRYFTPTHFIDMVGRGWVGTSALQTDFLAPYLKAALQGDKGLVLAVASSTGGSQDDEGKGGD